MLKNYLKIAVRNILRNKTYSIINIFGMALGLSIFILLSLFVTHELSYDKFHKDSGLLYRVVTDDYVGSPAPLAELIEAKIPEIEKTCRIKDYTSSSSKALSFGEKRFNESNIYLADPTFFQMFRFKFIHGDPSNCLNNVNSVVLTEQTAKKYFGDENPMGKSLLLENDYNLEVTGVIENIPANTHMNFSIVGSFELLKSYNGNSLSHWGGLNYFTYFYANTNLSPSVFEEKIGEAFTNNTEYSVSPYLVQRVEDIHLTSYIRGEMKPNSFLSDIYLYSTFAGIILLIACVNYMSLATSRYSIRMKEIGIRKVVGADRFHLIKQFFSESIFYSVISLIVAIIIVQFTLPLFNNLLGKDLSLLNNPGIVIIMISAALITGIISGSYPAILLSSFKPLRIIKGNTNVSSGALFRKILVTGQFSLTVFFLIIVLVASQQLSFLKETNLGFNKEHIINIPVGKENVSQYISLKNRLEQYPQILSTSLNNFLLSGNNWRQNTKWEGMQEGELEMMKWIPVDPGFIKTFELNLVMGRNFNESNYSKPEYILNQSAIKQIGWEDPIGKRFDIVGEGSVVGIVKDFNYKSLRTKVEPVALVIYPELFTYLSTRVATNNIRSTIQSIKSEWDKAFPNRPFNFFFFNEDYDALYKSEEKMISVFGVITILAITISCLGLFGLSLFTAEQKTKEIGIRKVLGASITSIVKLISWEFVLLIIIAAIIAAFPAYYFMNDWLTNFAYRIDMPYYVFPLAGLGALLIALLTVSYQAIKAASANPINSLRSE